MNELQMQLRNDPRVQAIVQQRRNGALTDGELRQLGYDVPDGYHYVFGGRAGNGTLMDNERGFFEKAAPWISIGMGAAGGAGAAGLIPGVGGVGGASAGIAPSTAATAGTAGSTAGTAGSTATGAGGIFSNVPYGAAAPGGGAAASGIGGGILDSIKSDPLGTFGKVGDIFGKGAQGAAQGRRDDAYAQAAAGRVNLDALALDQKRAALRSLLGGVQDASISRPAGSTIPTFQVNGGLRPSALSNKDALMAELSRPSPTVDNAKAGWGEKAMGAAGMIGGILDAFKKPKVPIVMDGPGTGGYGGNLPRY